MYNQQYVLYPKGGNLCPIVSGTAQDIINFLEGNGIQNLVGKTVTFSYRKETWLPVEKRILKVEEADKNYIKGTDAEADEFRQFLVTKIVGGKSSIKVLKV